MVGCGDKGVLPRVLYQGLQHPYSASKDIESHRIEACRARILQEKCGRCHSDCLLNGNRLSLAVVEGTVEGAELTQEGAGLIQEGADAEN